MTKLIASANTTLACFGDVPIEFGLYHISGAVYRIADSLTLGNMLVVDASEGLLVVDAKIADCYPALYDLIYGHFKKPVKFMVMSHCHPDHVAGVTGMCVDKPVIIAHENTADYVACDQLLPVLHEPFPALPEEFRPTVLAQDKLTLWWGDETLTLRHMPGHTDGDLVIFAEAAKVVHTADLCTFGGFPYVGINAGGGVDIMLTALKAVADIIDDATIVSPGHGELRDKAGLLEYIDLLQDARDNVAAMLRQKATLTEIIAEGPTARIAATYTGVGPLTQALFEELLYLALIQNGF